MKRKILSFIFIITCVVLLASCDNKKTDNKEIGFTKSIGNVNNTLDKALEGSFKLDSKGNLVNYKYTSLIESNNDLEIIWDYQYTNNKVTRLTKDTSEYKNKLLVSSSIEIKDYEYDEAGNCITYSNCIDGVTYTVIHYEYTNNLLTKEIVAIYGKDITTPDYYTYKYNYKNNHIDYIDVEYNSDDIEEKYTIKYSYNTDSNLEKVEYLSESNNVFNTIRYKYDSSKKLTQIAFAKEALEGTEILYTGFINYNYSEDGKLESTDMESVMSAVPPTKIKYEVVGSELVITKSNLSINKPTDKEEYRYNINNISDINQFINMVTFDLNDTISKYNKLIYSEVDFEFELINYGSVTELLNK